MQWWNRNLIHFIEHHQHCPCIAAVVMFILQCLNHFRLPNSFKKKHVTCCHFIGNSCKLFLSVLVCQYPDQLMVLQSMTEGYGSSLAMMATLGWTTCGQSHYLEIPGSGKRWAAFLFRHTEKLPDSNTEGEILYSMLAHSTSTHVSSPPRFCICILHRSYTMLQHELCRISHVVLLDSALEWALSDGSRSICAKRAWLSQLRVQGRGPSRFWKFPRYNAFWRFWAPPILFLNSHRNIIPSFWFVTHQDSREPP